MGTKDAAFALILLSMLVFVAADSFMSGFVRFHASPTPHGRPDEGTPRPSLESKLNFLARQVKGLHLRAKMLEKSVHTSRVKLGHFLHNLTMALWHKNRELKVEIQNAEERAKQYGRDKVQRVTSEMRRVQRIMESQIQELRRKVADLSGQPTETTTASPPINRDKEYFVNRRDRTWLEALSYCHRNGGRLAIIRSERENNLAVHALRIENVDRAWIGYTDRGYEGIWGWYEAPHLGNPYTKWGDGEPNNANVGEDCAELIQGSGGNFWNDQNCHSWYPALCEKVQEAPTTTPRPEPETTPAYEWTTAIIPPTREKEYYVTRGQYGWSSAVRHCLRNGDRLAVIRSERENRQAYTALMHSGLSRAWIAYNDRDTEGRWRWHGTYTPHGHYTKWGIGRPRGYYVSFDCAMMIRGGRWEDKYCWDSNSAICERVHQNTPAPPTENPTQRPWEPETTPEPWRPLPTHSGRRIRFTNPNNGTKLTSQGFMRYISGYVEIYHSTYDTAGWGSICDDDFDNNDAAVICRTGGYIGGRYDYGRYKQSEGGRNNQTSRIWLDDLRCNGYEENVDQCSHLGWGRHNCGHHEDVGIICYIEQAPTKPPPPPPASVLRFPRPQNSTLGGYVQGYVEIWRQGEWGSICDDAFDNRDARVVCRTGGYADGHYDEYRIKQYIHPSEKNARIWLDDLACTGNETNVEQCGHMGWGRHNCQRSEDVSLRCYTKPRTCSGAEMECGSECIQTRLQCDGFPHCPDGSDENFCRYKPQPLPTGPPRQCYIWEYRCNNTRCISGRFVCDGVNDCGDMSDEPGPQACANRTRPTRRPTRGPYPTWRPRSTWRPYPTWRPGTTWRPGPKPTGGPDDRCGDDEFTCDNGRCIPNSYRCDNDDDCRDMSDERPENCPRPSWRPVPPVPYTPWPYPVPYTPRPYPRNDNETIARWEKHMKIGLERAETTLRRLNAQRVKHIVLAVLGHFKRALKHVNSTNVTNAVKELNLESMVRRLNLEEMLKGLHLEKIVKMLPAEEIAESIVDRFHLHRFVDKESLKEDLENFFQGLDVSSIMEGVRDLLKGLDLVNLARSLDNIIHGVDLDIVRAGAESLIVAVENTVRDMDLESLLNEAEDLLRRMQSLDYSDYLRALLKLFDDLDRLTRSIDADNLMKIIEGMIKNVDFDVIKRRILSAMNDLKTNLRDLDLEEIKANILNGLNEAKSLMNKLKHLNIQAAIEDLDLDEILGHLDLEELFKNVENFLEDLELDRILKIFGIDEIQTDVGVIVRALAELLDNLDVDAFIKRVVDILVRSFDFDNLRTFWKNLLEGVNTYNLFKGFKIMVNGMDFEILRQGGVKIITGVESLFNAIPQPTGRPGPPTHRPHPHNTGDPDPSRPHPHKTWAPHPHNTWAPPPHNTWASQQTERPRWGKRSWDDKKEEESDIFDDEWAFWKKKK